MRPEGRPRARATGRGTVFALAAFAISAIAVTPACSGESGAGLAIGTLNVPDCWNGTYDLGPTFFGAQYDRGKLLVRLQRGSDFYNFSDGISMLINDVTRVSPPQPVDVGLPPEVTPPNVPIVFDPNVAPVSATLYMEGTCRTRAVTLHAMKTVTLPTDGSCHAPVLEGTDPETACGGAQDSELGTGKSRIFFSSVYQGDDRGAANSRLTEGCFDLYLADPREAPDPTTPPPCRGHLRGKFSFFFERGRPAQPFPGRD